MGARTRGLANNVLSSGKLDATDAISGTIAAGNIANDSLTSATTFGSVTGGVPAVASDPPSPADGDIWYNTTTGALRFRSKVGAWSTGGNLNTARRDSAGSGTQTAALCTGGEAPRTGATESYNGSSWTEVNDLNTARNQLASAGTQTSTIAFGGEAPSPTAVNESWNGTSWTEVNDLNVPVRNNAGFGDSTSAISAGGFGPGVGDYSTGTESWNGTSWTTTTAMPAAKAQHKALGTSTAGLVVAGLTSGPTQTSNTFEWNGSTWTAGGNVNTGRNNMADGMGTQDAGLISGGNSPPGNTYTALTELYNGTSWSEDADMSTARQQLSGLGTGSTSTAGLAVGGYNGSDTNATEEWSYADTTFTVG
jgi:hypothetical protein